MALTNLAQMNDEVRYEVQDMFDFRMTLKWKRANKTEPTNERKESDLIG